MRSQTVFLIISCILALMQSKTAQAYLQPYSSLEPIFRDNSTIQTSVASIMGQGLNDALLNIPELPACNIVVRSPVDHHSTHISMELIFDCGGWLACIDANVQSNKELFVNHLVGSTSGHCPKGKLLLGVLHTFAEVIGVKTIRLADASHIQLFRKRLSVLEDRISAKSSILLPLLSETEPREYTSYYSQFGYKIIGDSKSDLSNLNRNTQYLYSVSIKELLPQLRQSTTKEVKEILEGYPLFTPVSKVFRDLHQRGVEKSFEAHRDCIRLFQLIFSTDSEMSFFQSVPGLLDGSRLSKAIFNLGITRMMKRIAPLSRISTTNLANTFTTGLISPGSESTSSGEDLLTKSSRKNRKSLKLYNLSLSDSSSGGDSSHSPTTVQPSLQPNERVKRKRKATSGFTVV